MTAELRLRIQYPQGSIGPGKIALLEQIDATGSISAGAREMGMSFRRAWLLVDTMNRVFAEPVIKASHGGRSGGGAALTPFGRELVERYRTLEAAAQSAAEAHLRWLEKAMTSDMLD